MNLLRYLFQHGQGKIFEETMNSFIKDIRIDLKRTFSNEDFEKEKSLIKQELKKKEMFF